MLLTEERLVRWGEGVGEGVERPVFLMLRGPLGAGKSVFARAVARGAGVTGSIPSPTFNLLFRYPARDGTAVVHLDLYRIEDPEEVWEVGWEELGREGDLVLVEWPERAQGALPADRWEIDLAIPPEDETLRAVLVRPIGDPPPLPALPMAGRAEGGVRAGRVPGAERRPIRGGSDE